MPQLAPVNLNDGSSVRVFTPRGINANVAEHVELNASGVALARPRLTTKVSQNGSGRNKVEIRLAVPVVQNVVVAGITRPTIVRTGYLDLSFTTDAASTIDERAALRIIANSITANADMIAAIDGAVGFY